MSSLGSWIDAADLAAVARELCPEGGTIAHGRFEGRRRDFLLESGGATDTVGAPMSRAGRVAGVARHPAEEEIDRVREKLERIKALARDSGLLREASAETAGIPGTGGPGVAGADLVDLEAPEAFEPPEAALGTRLAAFARWAADVTGGADVFVIDAQGYPLVERGGDPDLLAAALLLGDASQRALHRFDTRAGHREPFLQVQLGDGFTLSVLVHESRYGTVCLGIHGRGKVSASAASALVHALAATL